jgi:orotidine-5'-phosphate decarboxylase
MIAEKLYKAAEKNAAVCVGLDTDVSYLPECIATLDLGIDEKIFMFNKAIIDATYEHVACYKVQIAYYEALGLNGLKAYAETLRYIRGKGIVAIADIKRGDIAATAQKYAQAHFEGDFEADYITLNAYMGEDAVSPYYPYFKSGKKGTFVLVKTSNDSGPVFQDCVTEDGTELYRKVAKEVDRWGSDFVDNSGFSSIGAVIGLTYPNEILIVKELMPKAFFLIPGYGAQGGTGKDLSMLFSDRICGVVNSSRGIIASHVKKGINEGFAEEALHCVLAMKEDIGEWR